MGTNRESQAQAQENVQNEQKQSLPFPQMEVIISVDAEKNHVTSIRGNGQAILFSLLAAFNDCPQFYDVVKLAVKMQGSGGDLLAGFLSALQDASSEKDQRKDAPVVAQA